MIEKNYNLTQLQIKAKQKFIENDGNLIAALPTGTGKTVLALDIIIDQLNENENSKILCICPASLRDNIPDTIHKFGYDDQIKNVIITSMNQLEELYDKYNVFCVSYNFARSHLNEMTKFKFDLLICDELHKAKNFISSTYISLWHLRIKVPKMLGLTASYISNNILEFLTLIALVSKTPAYIKSSKVFYDKSTNTIINQDKFKLLIGKWVYIPSKETLSSLTKSTPKPIEKVVEIEMTDEEYKVYQYVIGKIPVNLLIKFFNQTISPSELKRISIWLFASQMVLISPDYVQLNKDISELRPSSKIIYLKNKLITTKEKSIIFTPFLHYGAKFIDHYLNKSGVKSRLYAGPVSNTERRQIIDEFENGDLQCICLTAAGAEGLNLPSCKNVYFVTMSFNPEVMIQVMGRALRITSKLETVNIYYLLSKYKNEKTIDYRILQISQSKKILKTALHNILGETNLQEDMVSASLTGYETFSPVSNKTDKYGNKKTVFQPMYPLDVLELDQ